MNKLSGYDSKPLADRRDMRVELQAVAIAGILTSLSVVAATSWYASQSTQPDSNTAASTFDQR